MIKSIQIAETDYSGITEITADGWDGRILKMSHATCCEWIASSATPVSAGVYVLYADHFDRVTHGNKLYVGQTGAIAQRLGQHIGKKEFWTAVMVFISGGDWMNVAYTPNIEQQFIKWAKQANRYDLDNGDDGRVEHLGEDDQTRLQAFLAGVRPVLRLAGIDVFEVNMDGTFSYTSWNIAISHVKIASGRPNPVVTVLAGSRIAGLDATEVSQANLPGVSYDLSKRVHLFSESVDVPLIGDTIPTLLGYSVSRWKSRAGVTLHTVLGLI